MQIARLQIQLKQIIDVRIGPAEFENSFQLIEIPHPIDPLADLSPGDRKWSGTARTAEKASIAARFHECSSYIFDISSI
jgi:hypothetical protein